MVVGVGIRMAMVKGPTAAALFIPVVGHFVKAVNLTRTWDMGASPLYPVITKS